MHKSETIFASGKIFELVHVTQPDGRVFEIARRAPGVRLIIHDKIQRKILLTKEHRQELGDWDYRLPGGKVFDSLEEYEAFRSSGKDIMPVAQNKAIAEAAEECGLKVSAPRLISKSVLGATVEWDLYVFEVIDFSRIEGGQSLEAGETIEAEEWFDYSRAIEMILQGHMQEERIALITLRWLKQQKGEKV